LVIPHQGTPMDNTLVLMESIEKSFTGEYAFSQCSLNYDQANLRV
jgi:hypothetical protein